MFLLVFSVSWNNHILSWFPPSFCYTVPMFSFVAQHFSSPHWPGGVWLMPIQVSMDYASTDWINRGPQTHVEPSLSPLEATALLPSSKIVYFWPKTAILKTTKAAGSHALPLWISERLWRAWRGWVWICLYTKIGIRGHTVWEQIPWRYWGWPVLWFFQMLIVCAVPLYPEVSCAMGTNAQFDTVVGFK